MAFESDDDDERPRAGKSDPSELGALAAGLPASERRSSAPPGPDTDDAIDAAALAALSKGQKAARITADGDDGRVKLQGAPVGPASVPPPNAAPGQRSSYGWLIGLAIGFAVGVPVGGLLFPHTTVVSIPAPAKAGTSPTEAQLAAAEARARAADEEAAAVRPLPAQRLAEQAQAAPAAPAADPVPRAAEQPAAEAPAGAATPQPSAAAATPGAAAAAKKSLGPDTQSREAARAATAALNANPGAATAAPAAQPAAAPAAASAAPAQPAAAPTGPDGRSVDDLLDQALASSTAKKEQERAERALAPANPIPQSPSRDDVTRAMTVILPAIRGCAAGQSGLATIGIVVKNDGHVESASVTGAPFEGERSGRCIEGVVRRAKFPRFQQSSFRIQFPLAIQ